MKLTANEFKVLRAIDMSEYGDSLLDAIWSWSIADNSDLNATSIGGIVTSLKRKGLVEGGGTHKDASIGMTLLGAIEYRSRNGGKSIKWLPDANGRYPGADRPDREEVQS